MKFKAKTPNREIEIEVFSKYIPNYEIKTSREYFENLCQKGCKNYGNKWCCPPFTPKFEAIAKKQGIYTVIFLCRLWQIQTTEYNKIRIANSVIKSRIEKLMRTLEKEFSTIHFSNGSCRLCKPCRKKLNEPCRYPEKKRYSLEATGVDCQSLLKENFDLELQWFNKGKAPEYTLVITGLVCNESEKNKIEEEIKEIIKQST